jgi:hypothetical protein
MGTVFGVVSLGMRAYWIWFFGDRGGWGAELE